MRRGKSQRRGQRTEGKLIEAPASTSEGRAGGFDLQPHASAAQPRHCSLYRSSVTCGLIVGFAGLGTEDIWSGRDTKDARRTLEKSLWPVARRKVDMVNAHDVEIVDYH